MVVKDEIYTIDNQPEVIQPVEAEKSHLIPNEKNHSNDNPTNNIPVEKECSPSPDPRSSYSL